jgi:uncharacterized protein YdeI (YjbR/CyaY-like superfamily)
MRVGELEAEGLMERPGLVIVENARRDGTWQGKPRPEVPDGIPDELAEALEANHGAKVFFESLSPSCRNRFVMWVAMAKRPATRKKRVRESVALLEKGEKLGLR